MGVLNRDEGVGAITPGVVRFASPEQAAGYFMLGETSKTSAAGKDRGLIRSPFTQPFFPREHGLQAKRFAKLMESTDQIQTWMMNTGMVGGDIYDIESGMAFKVKIRHSSALLGALFAEKIVWIRDQEFGYDVVDVDHPDNAALAKIVPMEILSPKRFYANTHRTEVYASEVKKRHAERRAFLEIFDVDPKIIAAVCL